MSSSNFIIDSDIDGDDQSGDRDDQSRDRDVQSADRDDYSGDDCDDYSRCVAYVDFKDLIDNIRSKYTHLNPKDGKLFQHVRRSQDRSDLTLDETGQEFIRGGIVWWAVCFKIVDSKMLSLRQQIAIISTRWSAKSIRFVPRLTRSSVVECTCIASIF